MKRYILVVVSLLIFITKGYSNHLSGGNISYRNLGNQKYEVTVTIIRDCNGIGLGNTPIKASCSAGTSNFTLTLVSVKDVTGIGQQCTVRSKCVANGKSKYGLVQHIYKGIIDLSILNCCEVTFSWAQCCRVRAINTSTAFNKFYIEAAFNKCVGSSLEWGNLPLQTYLHLGKDQILNFSAIDTVTNDSISYKLVNPLSTKGTPIAYNSGLSSQKPLSYLGFPADTGKRPAGFHLDTLRGNIEFRPTVANQVTIISVEATAWRKINGSMQIVGLSKSEQVLSVISQQNSSTPYQKPINVFKACIGDTSAALIEVNNNLNKKYSINLKHNFKWAKAEFVEGTRYKYVAVYYVTDSITPTLFTSAFTLDIKNNDCPIAGRTVKTYGVDTGGVKFIDSAAIIISSSCGRVQFSINKKNTSPNMKYTWVIKKDTTTQYVNGSTHSEVFKDTGWIKVTLIASLVNYCNFYTYSDSIYVRTADIVKVRAKSAASAVCNSMPFKAFITETLGKQPFTYKWSTGQQGDTILIAPNKKGKYYFVEMTDSAGCKMRDSIKNVNYHPIITISGDSLICKGDSIHLAATIMDSISPTYSWVDFPMGQLQIEKTVSIPTQYIFTITDGSCTISKTVSVKISTPQAVFSHPLSVCQGTPIQLTANPQGGRAPYKVYWDSYQRNGNSVSISTQNAKLGTSFYAASIIDNLGCTGLSVGSFKILPIPKISLKQSPAICENDETFALYTLTQPKGGVWEGQGIKDSTLNATLTNIGINEIEYHYTNIEGCSDSATINIKVYRQPVVGFTADSLEIYRGSKVNFTNTTLADTAYNSWWNFGDEGKIGNIFIGINGSYIFNDTGKYSITLKINNGVCSPDSLTKTNYIKIGSYYLSSKSVSKRVVKLYPNPASKSITIEADEDIVQIDIYDVLGRRYKIESTNNSTKIEINIQHLPTGIYVIMTKDIEGNSYTNKVQITR